MRASRLFLCATLSLGLVACGDEPSLSPTPMLTSVDVTLDASVIEVGQVIKVTATPLDQHGDPISSGDAMFASSDPHIAEVDARTGSILGISSGTAQIIATVGARSGQRTISVAFPPAIVVNEIKTNDDGPGGWLELYNPTSRVVDLAGWKVANEHVDVVGTLPAGTRIAANGYLILEESVFPLGLSRLGGAHLFSRFNVLVDDPFWSTPIVSTFGRCPNGGGDLVPLKTPTRGAMNVC